MRLGARGKGGVTSGHNRASWVLKQSRTRHGSSAARSRQASGRPQRRQHWREDLVGERVDLGGGAGLDRVRDVEDGGLDAQRIALRRDAVDEWKGIPGQAASGLAYPFDISIFILMQKTCWPSTVSRCQRAISFMNAVKAISQGERLTASSAPRSRAKSGHYSFECDWSQRYGP
jgi:hypothetical protein